MRVELVRPKYLADQHWNSVVAEVGRVERALDAEDANQVLGTMKCLVEAVARVTLEVAGEPAAQNDALSESVTKAHNLLTNQPGHGLAREGPVAKIASNAKKIAVALGEMRNTHGTGHGRAGVPAVPQEMVDVAVDGGLLWIRWAVRRLGLFSEGRPAPLIRDLVEQPAVFRSGDLRRRLEAANLNALEEHHQIEIGVAVARRVMQNTFVVKRDGLDACIESDDLEVWPGGYRIGLLRGLWFAADGSPTVTAQSIRDGISVLDPLPDVGGELADQVNLVCSMEPPWTNTVGGTDWNDALNTMLWLRNRADVRPQDEYEPLNRLANHIDPGPF